MKKLVLTLVSLLFSATSFAATTNTPNTAKTATSKMVQKIVCEEPQGDSKGSRITIFVRLSKKIDPIGQDVLYGLTGSVTLKFRADIAEKLKIKSTIVKKNLQFEKEHAMYSHELSTMWEPRGVNDSVSRLALIPVINSCKFSGMWTAELFEATITTIGLSIKENQFTGEPGLICAAQN